MKFITETCVSSHDLAHNTYVRPSAVLRYMMEAANRNMAAQKPSYTDLLEQGYAFLVSRTHLRVLGDLRAYDTLTVETWAVPEKGASFDRCYRLLRGGEVMAEAYTVFALLNLKTGALCRAGEVTLPYYHDEPLPISTRFRLPDIQRNCVGQRVIRYADIDCNGHMNNANYPDMLCDFIPEIDTLRVTDIQIQYVNEAPLGETLLIWRSCEVTAEGLVYAFETKRADDMVNVRALISAKPAKKNSGF